MPVDFGNLIDSLKREINPAGQNLYPTTTDDEWLGRLSDAFWEARLSGMLAGFVVDDNGICTSLPAGGADMTRDLQQLVVLFAGYRVVLNEMRTLNTQFRAQAGPVSFEQQKSANTLRDVLKAIQAKIGLVLDRLSDVGHVNAAVMDAVITKSFEQFYADNTWWVRG